MKVYKYNTLLTIKKKNKSDGLWDMPIKTNLQKSNFSILDTNLGICHKRNFKSII